MKNHDEVLRANRELYKDIALLEDFAEYCNVPIVRKHVQSTIESALAWVDRKDTSQFSDVAVLDVGTGMGHLLQHFIQHVPEQNIFALDVSRTNIEMVRSRFPGIHCVEGDFINSFADGAQFGLISAYSVLHHFYDAKAFFAKLDRLLRPGGVFYIDHEPLAGFLLYLYTRLALVRNRSNESLLTAEYHQFYEVNDPFEIRAMLPNYEVKIYFQNTGLLGEIYKKTGFDLSRLLPREYGVAEKRHRRFLRHFFVSYTMVGKKLK